MTATTAGSALRAQGALLVVTVAWGSTFVVVQQVTREVPITDFLGLRFGIAAVLMFVIRPRALSQLTKEQRGHGLMLGLFLTAGFLLQTFGLARTTPTISAFITGLFVVFTPIAAWVLMRRAIEPLTWVGVALAVAGLAFLSLRGWSIGFGEILTLFGAIAFALHIVNLGRWATRESAYGLAVIQLGVVSVVCSALGCLDGFELPQSKANWLAVVFLAIFATAIAFFVQTWAQSVISPTRAAVVMTMEPVFATLVAVLFINEPITVRIVIGAICVLAAMYLVELGPRHAEDAAIQRLEM
jgi:drug/metabolite transporter (DMT)-like permease